MDALLQKHTNSVPAAHSGGDTFRGSSRRSRSGSRGCIFLCFASALPVPANSINKSANQYAPFQYWLFMQLCLNSVIMYLRLLLTGIIQSSERAGGVALTWINETLKSAIQNGQTGLVHITRADAEADWWCGRRAGRRDDPHFELLILQIIQTHPLWMRLQSRVLAACSGWNRAFNLAYLLNQGFWFSCRFNWLFTTRLN